ncbi:hypothetical protein M3Y94_00454600 [Aphelenchoides besseyi]|nr:hypothetical protein M3Y94_00454600 [Aphelenchoides besseyi]
MAVVRTDSSSASIQLPDIRNEQSDLLNNSLDHIDGPTEVVISGTSEQNEIEKLEAHLVELSCQHTHHSTKLKHWMAQDILRESFPECSITGIEVMKWIVIFDAFFLFIRLVFMTDIIIVFAPFNLISLILLVVGYTCAQHFFFWPFALTCLFEMEVATFQMFFICVMFFQSRKSRLSLAKEMDLPLYSRTCRADG